MTPSRWPHGTCQKMRQLAREREEVDFQWKALCLTGPSMRTAGQLNIPQDESIMPAGGRCFYNAQRLALAVGASYCEGLAYDGKEILHHAWCLDQYGAVLEITPGWWGGCLYLGKVFSESEVIEHIRKNGPGVQMLETPRRF